MTLDSAYRKTRKTHSRGTRVLQPLATDVLEGTLYFVTDEGVIERSNGTIWESFSGISSGSQGLRGFSGLDGIDGENTEVIILGNSNIPLAVPGGSSGQIQFNNGGVFAGDSDLTFLTDTLTATKIKTPDIIGAGTVTITPNAGSNFNVTLSTTGDLAVNTNQFYVDTSTAFVGIGTANPGNALHVVGGADAARFDGGSRSLYISIDSGGPGIFNSSAESGEGVYLSAASNYIGVFVSSVERARFTTTRLTMNIPVNLKNYTVATLPAGTRGDIAYVTDALAPAFLAVLVGGGTVVTPCFYNGTNWVGF